MFSYLGGIWTFGILFVVSLAILIGGLVGGFVADPVKPTRKRVQPRQDGDRIRVAIQISTGDKDGPSRTRD